MKGRFLTVTKRSNIRKEDGMNVVATLDSRES